MKSLHVEGTGWLYRVPPRLKLLTLMVFSIALFLTRDLILLGCAVVLAAAILRQTRLPLREIGLRLRPVMLTILLVAAFSYLLRQSFAADSTGASRHRRHHHRQHFAIHGRNCACRHTAGKAGAGQGRRYRACRRAGGTVRA
mgnify:CR=1 FL=1